MDKYNSFNDCYCYAGTDVLKNKFNIKNSAELENAEREITAVSIKDINYLDPPYSLEYLQNLHKQIFSDLYEWAGEIRTIDISKGTTRFCTHSRIIPECNKTFNRLKNENYLENIPHFIEKFADYYADFNVLHPFREGNGRVTRLFFEHLAAYNEYSIHWSFISQEQWLNATIKSYFGDNANLISIFKIILKKESLC